MSSVNKVILIGNSGRDPELRHTSDGKAVCNVSLATSRGWKDKDGARQEEVEWHRVVFYERLAEIAGEYLKKGKPVYIEGRLKTRKWQDKEGRDQYTTEIIAEQMQLLGGRDQSEPSEAKDAPPTPKKHADRPGGANNRPKAGTGFDDMDSDIPF